MGRRPWRWLGRDEHVRPPSAPVVEEKRPRSRLLVRALMVASLCGTVLVAGEAFFGKRQEWAASLDLSDHATVWISILMATYAATFLAYYRPRRLEARPFALVAAIGLALITFVLGLAAYWDCQGQEAWLWTPVSNMIALFFGSVASPFGDGQPCAGPVPVALQAARLTAVLATVTAGAAAIVAVFRDQWDRIRVRFARDVVVVVGLDAQSIRILEALAADPAVTEMVVGVDTEVGTPYAAEARAHGARVLVGSTSDESWLTSTLRAPRIRAAYLLSPRPDENLALLETVDAQVRDKARGSGWSQPARVIVRLDDRWEADHWRRAHILKSGGVLLDTIGVMQVTANLLIERASEAGVDSLVVLGNSALASAVVDELAQLWREEATLVSPRRFDVALVDPEADLLWLDHEFHERSLGNEPLHVVRRAEAASAAVIAGAVDAASSGRAAPEHVVVLDCREPSAESYRSAQRISASRPDWTVLVWREESRGIDRPTMRNLVPFGLTLLAGDEVPEDGWTRLARRLHTQYVEGREADKPTRLPWDQLDEFLKVSNLRQVARTLYIAEQAGRTWSPGDGGSIPSPLTADEIATYARLEHDDWFAYYRDHGWVQGPDDYALKQNPYLQPWDDLDEEDRRSTIKGVTNSLEQLTTLGYQPFAPGSPLHLMARLGRYRRRGLVTAVREESGWTWTTKAGDVLSAEAGDWRVEADGRTWSVRDDAFRATYRQVEGDQWERTGEVTAREVVTGESVATLEGPVTAAPGDWVVEDAEGRRWVVPGEQFDQGYAPL